MEEDFARISKKNMDGTSQVADAPVLGLDACRRTLQDHRRRLQCK